MWNSFRWSLKYRQSILAVYFTTNSAIVQDSFHMLRKIMSHRFLLVHAEPLSDPSRDNFLRENTELTFRHVAGFNVRTTWITFRYAFGHLGINHSIHTQEIYINSVRMRAETNPDIKCEEGSTWWRPCGTNILTCVYIINNIDFHKSLIIYVCLVIEQFVLK